MSVLDSTQLDFLDRLMEGNSSSNSTGLEWENLALFTGNNSIPIHDSIPNHLGFSMPSSDDFGASRGDPFIGLGLGSHQQKEYSFPSASSARALISSIPVSSMPAKRSRASYHNMQNPCCQVEGCNLDLKLAKDYHRRHRICETHSKSPKVIVAGMERRFCQQCSRFHDLSEFDDKKRSCRRRLSDHNARRRRVQPDSVQLTSPALYADQRQQNVLLNGLPVSLSSSTWENALISRPPKATLNFSSDDVSNLHMDLHRSNPRILDHCLHVPSTSSSMAPDLLSAHSLLSSNAWSYNEGDHPTSMEGIMHGGYAPVMRHSEAEQHHLTLFQSNNMGGDHDLHNAGPSHHQEYQLFKSPYDSASFYSSQRSL